MSLTVHCERGEVIVNVGKRTGEAIVNVDQAEKLVDALYLKAHEAEVEERKSNGHGRVRTRQEQWSAHVSEFEGRVALRFLPPEPGKGAVARLTPEVARGLAFLVNSRRLKILYRDRFGS